ncbi:MAG TPA: NAD-dependent epimerase/dehydratase family protein [Gemmatimonadaceae bacterium]
MPRALVTGATGLVGSHIAERLTASGWTVRALVRRESHWLNSIGVEQAVGDVLDPSSFASAARGSDTIFHNAAAITDSGGWETYRRLNVDGTRAAIDAAASVGARLMHLSSVAVYGPEGRYSAGGKKTDEDSPFATLPEGAYYARSKRESEQLVLAAHEAGKIWATAVRPTVIYGRRDRQFVPRAARLLQRGFAPLIGGGTSTLSLVHAGNVADGAILAARSEVAGGRVYNLAHDFDVTVRDCFLLAARGLGRRVRFIPIPLSLANVAVRAFKAATRMFSGGRWSAVSNASIRMLTKDNPFTSERARRELGWSPRVRPEEGIPDAFRWWLEHRRGEQ